MNNINNSKLLSLLILYLICFSCSHKKISGTSINETLENSKIFDIVGKLEKYLRARNTKKILNLVSKNYFEDMGSFESHDDYGYQVFEKKVLKNIELTKVFHLNIKIYDIQVNADQTKAHADIRYKYNAKVDLPTGSVWDNNETFNRIQFVKENDMWKIISGL